MSTVLETSPVLLNNVEPAVRKIAIAGLAIIAKPAQESAFRFQEASAVRPMPIVSEVTSVPVVTAVPIAATPEKQEKFLLSTPSPCFHTEITSPLISQNNGLPRQLQVQRCQAPSTNLSGLFCSTTMSFLLTKSPLQRLCNVCSKNCRSLL